MLQTNKQIDYFSLILRTNIGVEIT